jgi:hypothetical protein
LSKVFVGTPTAILETITVFDQFRVCILRTSKFPFFSFIMPINGVTHLIVQLQCSILRPSRP